MHFRHKWETETQRSLTMKCESILFGRKWNSEGILVIKKCSVCGKRQAWTVTPDSKTRMLIEFAEQLLGEA